MAMVSEVWVCDSSVCMELQQERVTYPRGYSRATLFVSGTEKQRVREEFRAGSMPPRAPVNLSPGRSHSRAASAFSYEFISGVVQFTGLTTFSVMPAGTQKAFSTGVLRGQHHSQAVTTLRMKQKQIRAEEKEGSLHANFLGLPCCMCLNINSVSF